MDLDKIREIAKSRPFKMFEIHVDNGEKHFIQHPENIIVSNQFVMTVNEQGDAVLITPEAISSIVTYQKEKQY